MNGQNGEQLKKKSCSDFHITSSMLYVHALLLQNFSARTYNNEMLFDPRIYIYLYTYSSYVLDTYGDYGVQCNATLCYAYFNFVRYLII